MKALVTLAILAWIGLQPNPALAQNVLVNPGFEDGATGSGVSGWFSFGNVFTEAANPPQFEPFEGNQLVSMFGNFSGGFNVTGFFQEVPAAAGSEWNLSCKTRHWSNDALEGAAGSGNWVVQKIVFKDAADAELPGAVESIVLDGTFATDVWHNNSTISGIAPVGTVQIEAFLLYLQPAFAGGAAQVDNVELTQTPEAVAVDIHPGSCPNPLNVVKRGVVPVAILGSADFDVSNIDASTVQLAGVSARKSRVNDVATPYSGNDCGCNTDGPDGYADLHLVFLAEDIAAAVLPASFKEERVLTLTGNLLDGTPIEGSDCVMVLGTPKSLVTGPPGDRGTLNMTVRDNGPGQQIDFVLPEPAEVSLSVFDVNGRLVERLVQAYEAAGDHTVAWNSSSRPNGVYFYRLRAGNESVTQKVVIVNR